MEMDTFASMMLNSGVSIAVIAYFMYRDNKFMTQLQQTLQTLVDTVSVLHACILEKCNVEEEE